MPVKFDPRKIEQNMKRLEAYMKRDAPRIVGTEAVNHFKKSFDEQGFTDIGRTPWKAAKRTRPESPWLGFEAGARTRVPASHPRRRGKGKYKARKANPITNYSPAATKRKTLSGRTGDLRDSIQYRIEAGFVRVFSNIPYAALHNRGGSSTVFGRKNAYMPARQFMGPSMKLNARTRQLILKDIDRIVNG